MYKHQVRDPGQALAYVIDCTLATVCELAMKKSRGQWEFKRQKQIAQTALDWAVQFGIGLGNTRAADVVKHYGSSVESWAKQFDVRAHVAEKREAA